MRSLDTTKARRAAGPVALAGGLVFAVACGMRAADPGFASEPAAPQYEAGANVSPIPSLVGSDAALGAIVDGGSLGPTSAATAPSFGGPLLGPFTDFPSDPILDGADAGSSTGAGAPPDDAAQLFGAPTQGAASGGPCLIE